MILLKDTHTGGVGNDHKSEMVNMIAKSIGCLTLRLALHVNGLGEWFHAQDALALFQGAAAALRGASSGHCSKSRRANSRRAARCNKALDRFVATPRLRCAAAPRRWSGFCIFRTQ